MRYLNFSFLLLIVVSCNPQDKTEIAVNPNIIIILADDLGYGDISSFNSEGKIITPHIDEMAERGMKFTDAHTTSSVCTPTRYGILTGRYNWRSTLKQATLTGKSNHLIDRERTTLSSMLKSKGYSTGFIGKWHLGWDWAKKYSEDTAGVGWNPYDFYAIDFSKPVENGPNTLGFDYSYGHSGSLDMAPYVYVENGIPTAVPDTSTVDRGEYSWWREGPTAPDFIHEDVTPNFFRRSYEFIKQEAQTTDPFFLYLALPSPHTPILPTDSWKGKSGLLPYADFVLEIDDYMGRLNDLLDSLGIAENTLVIFTSDNGCSPSAGFTEMIEMGHHPSAGMRGHKADIYEGGHRVPFIAQWPRVIPAGTQTHEIISTTDFMRTLAEVVDYQLSDSEGEDSYSFLNILKGETPETPLREATVHHSIGGQFAIRKGNWKLILTGGSGGWSFPNRKEQLDTLPKIQLYDLQADLAEKHNLWETHPDKVKELSELLLKYIDDGRSTPGTAQSNDPIEKEWKQMTHLRNLVHQIESDSL